MHLFFSSYAVPKGIPVVCRVFRVYFSGTRVYRSDGQIPGIDVTVEYRVYIYPGILEYSKVPRYRSEGVLRPQSTCSSPSAYLLAGSFLAPKGATVRMDQW